MAPRDPNTPTHFDQQQPNNEMNTPTPTATPTPRTDAAWASSFEPCEYRAAHTARTMRDECERLETELAALTAERDHWQKIAVSASREREHNANVAQAMTAERNQLRAELALLREWQQEVIQNANAHHAERRDAIARAELAEAELATARARLADLVADLNDACITLESAKNDCDDYAMQNTEFKLMAVRNVLLQYIPNAAIKEGAK